MVLEIPTLWQHLPHCTKEGGLMTVGFGKYLALCFTLGKIRLNTEYMFLGLQAGSEPSICSVFLLKIYERNLVPAFTIP